MSDERDISNISTAYREELKDELAELEASYEDWPSEYKANRIHTLKQRLNMPTPTKRYSPSELDATRRELENLKVSQQTHPTEYKAKRITTLKERLEGNW